MRIYVSGPITHDPHFREHFQEHAQKLRDKGHTVLDPTVWDREKVHLSYDEYMKLDLTMLEVCNAIYMLPGWADSKGAKQELDRAAQLGLRIFYADQNDVPRVQKIVRK